MNRITLTVSAAVVALAATGIYHLLAIQNALSHVPTHQISSSPDIPDSFQTSKAAGIVNPNNHVPIRDTRFITLQISNSLSDEEVLARFVKGFFGGHVFKPERAILRTVGKEIAQFDRLKDVPVSSRIWTPAQLSAYSVPPLHSILFGAFRVVDCHLTRTHSYIDFAFGSDDGFIAGVHRFSILRNGIEAEESKSTGAVIIEFAHMGCNPRENKPMTPEVLQTLHLWYAMLLFREGVAEVVKA